MPKNNTSKVENELTDKIPLTGEIFMRERIDEDTKEKRYSVAVTIDNPFAEHFDGGIENEYNKKISLGFKQNKAKAKAVFNHLAKERLATCEKIEITGFVQRKKFYDQAKFKSVRYTGIFINSPFDDSVITLTIPRADTHGLFEYFAEQRLTPLK